ncbi:MAG: hypothetical protein ACO1N3_04215 [Gammaproteobacteria bacterium]
MTTLNFNLRGIDPSVMNSLKREAEKQHISVNSLILNCINQGFGYSYKIDKPTYNDLDFLAGTWQADDAKEFSENTAYFEQIDKDLWE